MNQLQLHFFWTGVFAICKGIIHLLFAAALIKYLWS
jgi:hypothetical protein